MKLGRVTVDISPRIGLDPHFHGLNGVGRNSVAQRQVRNSLVPSRFSLGVWQARKAKES